MSKRKSNIFTSVPRKNIKRNMFDLSHEVKMTGKFGILYPVLLLDTLPGDTVRDQMTAMIRFAPMLAPIMHRVDVTTHFFFVPNRILSDPWEEFITGGQDGQADVTLPFLTPGGIGADMASPQLMTKGTLWDYLGLPIYTGSGTPVGGFAQQIVSALPFRAYAKIWNDFYRDPNLDQELELNLASQGNVSSPTVNENLMTLKRRMWEKDYFTSALPWTQRGAEVLLPLQGTGSVSYLPVSEYYKEGGAAPGAGATAFASGVAGNLYATADGAPAPGNLTGTRVENIDEVVVDASDVTMNDFVRALAIQRWLENNARGGGRYIEQINSHFGVIVPDYRLQRAEYLGGGRQPVTISEVLSMAETELPLGEMGGHGISVGKSNRFTYRCQEHGWVLGILSVVPRTAYSQGIDKMWTRTLKFDFGWPELANLGEQEIVSREIFFDFAQPNQDDNEAVFGYIPRYAEYKFKNDRIAGDFRDDLAFWHLGRLFVSRPVLESSFTTMWENNTSDEESYRRIFAVTGDPEAAPDYLWMQLFHRLTAKRPLPYFGVPSI